MSVLVEAVGQSSCLSAAGEVWDRTRGGCK